jgi:ribonucleoside-diphosphate reductase beta chain
MQPKANYSFIQFDRNYETSSKSLFLGERLGLLDTVNRTNEDIWYLYELLKSLDWSPRDVSLESTREEFKKAPSKIVNLMINNLAWQWEADSVVSSLISIIEPYISNTEVKVYFQEVSRNEVLHAITYSEIVRNSFDNPREVLEKILANKESLIRMQTVNNVFEETHKVALDLNLNKVSRDNPSVRDTLMKFLVALFCLERIQFMGSFATTFGIGKQGMFLAPVKLIQKIFIDEYHIHTEGDRVILSNELSTIEGQQSFERIKNTAQEIITEVTDNELNWILHNYEDYMLEDIAVQDLMEFTYYGVTDVCHTLGLPNPYKNVTVNPLPFMNEYININKYKRSPQEEDGTNYLAGGFIDDGAKVSLADV